MQKLHKCHDCGVEEGQTHKPGCDMERCPFCGGQLISCECCYQKLNIDVSEGTWAYEHGLTNQQGQKWQEMLEEKGLIPYLVIPNLCRLCGKQWPDMFSVSDEEWVKYVIPELQREILCESCYNKVKILFPNGWQNVNKVDIK